MRRTSAATACGWASLAGWRRAERPAPGGGLAARPVRRAALACCTGLARSGGPLRSPASRLPGCAGIGADQVEILAALHQHAAAGFDQHPPVRIGEARHFHRAFENHHLRGALGIHLDAEFGAAHRDRRGGTVHPVGIRLAREVIDLHPHHAQRDAEELAQRGRRAVILQRHDGFRRHHHHAAVAEIDHHAAAAPRIDAVAGVQDVAGGQRQRRQAGRQQDRLARSRRRRAPPPPWIGRAKRKR